MKKMLLIILAVAIIAGCASVPLTPEQQAQSAISKTQGQLNVMFDAAKSYYDSKPDKKDEWVNKVVPAFDVVNKALYKLSISYKEGNVSATDLIKQAASLQNEIEVLLIGLGVLK